MKYILLLSILLLSINCFAQTSSQIPHLPKDSLTKKITYKGVVIDSGKTKQQLYQLARDWFAKAFNDSKSVIQMDDKDAGEIMGKGVYEMGFNAPFSVDGYTKFTLTILVKDGRYKYCFTDFLWTDAEGKYKDLDFDNPDKYWGRWLPKKEVKMYEQLDTNLKQTIQSLKVAMKANSSLSNW